jgi:ATP-dependent protease ClpP protease subunit
MQKKSAICTEAIMNEEFDFPEETETDEPGLSEQEQSTIQELGAITVKGAEGKPAIHCLTIVGQVEGHQLLPQNVKTTKYEHVLPQLAAIEESPEIGGLLILLNTVGGDIEAGLAIAELISGLSTPAVSLVLGGGHSIGVPMAVAARVSMIAPSAAMTIHPVRMNGTVLGVPQTFAYLRKIQERIVRFVAQHSRVSEEEYLRLMHRTDELAGDMGSVIHGAEAVEMGLIGRLGTLRDALGELHGMIEKNA